MKFFVGLALLAVIGFCYADEEACAITIPRIEAIQLANKCNEQVIKQVKMEVDASYSYLQVAAYFSRDTVNRPGFAELFFKASKEEREHAIKLLNYLSMRLATEQTVGRYFESGLLSKKNDNGKKSIAEELKETENNVAGAGVAALQLAYNMEKKVTKSIHDVISACDSEKKSNNQNEYHVSDYLTGDFLTEQYESERFFAGKLATLTKMIEKHGSLAEFLFDKTL